MGFMDAAKKLIGKHDQQVDQAIEKAGDLADKQTGGRYAAQVDKVQDIAQEKTGQGDTAE
jgi:hypothetical protein